MMMDADFRADFMAAQNSLLAGGGSMKILVDPFSLIWLSAMGIPYQSINQKFIGMHQSILGTSTMFTDLGTAAYAGAVYGGPVLGHT